MLVTGQHRDLDQQVEVLRACECLDRCHLGCGLGGIAPCSYLGPCSVLECMYLHAYYLPRCRDDQSEVAHFSWRTEELSLIMSGDEIKC
jgi:hypothetical protein